MVEWGHTDQAVVTEALDRLAAAGADFLGAVFNKAQLKALRRYGVPGSMR